MTISRFSVLAERPRAFVIMQFSSPYNDVYSEVIQSVAAELDLEVVRADEMCDPGIIIEDVSKQIRDAKIVIADLSPINANVYYELGYAHALEKPTVLLAERETNLPFDVAGFRTLFYENSIGGKRRLEEGLRRHLRAILGFTRGDLASGE